MGEKGEGTRERNDKEVESVERDKRDEERRNGHKVNLHMLYFKRSVSLASRKFVV